VYLDNPISYTKVYPTLINIKILDLFHRRKETHWHLHQRVIFKLFMAMEGLMPTIHPHLYFHNVSICNRFPSWFAYPPQQITGSHKGIQQCRRR